MSTALREAAAGALAPIQGVIMLVRSRGMWPAALLPLLLGLAWSAFSLLLVFAVPRPENWFWAGVHYALRGVLLSGIIFVQTLIALAAPILDLLSEKTEQVLGARPRTLLWRDLLRARVWWRMLLALIEAVKLLGFKLLLVLASTALSWIPIAGPPLAYLISGLATGIDFLDYPLARRDIPLRTKLAWARQHWAAALAFGATVLFLLSIPGVGGIMLTPSVVGGTYLLLQLGDVSETVSTTTPAPRAQLA